jgi:NhaP-type Na+/H+ and K+/H+ antiporter
MQDQMAFLIKSFFFFLIGLMFPTDLRQIALAAVGVLFLIVMQKKEFWFLTAANNLRSCCRCAVHASDAIGVRGRRIWPQPYSR